jgi:hypothetical protein
MNFGIEEVNTKKDRRQERREREYPTVTPSHINCNTCHGEEE